MYDDKKVFGKWVYDQPSAFIPTYTFAVYLYVWINWIIKNDDDGEYNPRNILRRFGSIEYKLTFWFLFSGSRRIPVYDYLQYRMI